MKKVLDNIERPLDVIRREYEDFEKVEPVEGYKRKDLVEDLGINRKKNISLRLKEGSLIRVVTSFISPLISYLGVHLMFFLFLV